MKFSRKKNLFKRGETAVPIALAHKSKRKIEKCV